MMRHLRVILPLLLLLGAWLPPATADDKAPVEIEVWVIRATKQNKDVSKELTDLADALKKQFKYTGFDLAKKISKKDLGLGKTHKADMIDGYQIAVTPKARTGKRIQVELQITRRVGKDKKEETVLKTTMTIPSGPFLPVGCGPLSGGDYLITAVRAR